MLATFAWALCNRLSHGCLFPPSQILLRSSALEITAEACLSNPLPSHQQPKLEQLLCALLPCDAAASARLAAVIAHLRQLVTAEAPELLPSMQRAVHSVVKRLKQVS